MTKVNKKWLPHLDKEVVSETEGNYLDAYVVALEGWRRGLTLKWHSSHENIPSHIRNIGGKKKCIYFSLSSKKRKHYFLHSLGDRISEEALSLCLDENRRRKALAREQFSPLSKNNRTSTERYHEESIYKIYMINGNVTAAIKTSKKQGKELNQGLNLAEVPKEVINLSIRAFDCFPGVFQAVIKITDSIGKYVVLDIDIAPEVNKFLFPESGEASDLPKKIIDTYFPEVGSIKEYQCFIYFDLKKVMNPILKGAAVQTKVPTIDYENPKIKKINFHISETPLLMIQQIRDLALKRAIYGTLKNDRGEIELIVFGEKSLLSEYITELKEMFPTLISNEERFKDHFVKAGFETIDFQKQLLKEIKTLESKMIHNKEKQEKLRQDYSHMLSSLSWKLTAPMRKITEMMKEKPKD